MNKKAIMLSKLIPVLLAVTLVAAQVYFTNAASYARTTLRDMTKRAIAVAEVTVTSRSYPAFQASEFPRTNVEVTVNKTLKGSLPTTMTLDLPGAVHGNMVYSVPDSASFEINERAIVFVKEGKAGQFMVQDLGLGKFNLVNRDGQTYVESPLCPKAMQNANDDIETSLLTKSIPYNDFCNMINAYASNEQPTVNTLKLAMINHTCPTGGCNQSPLVADALKNVAVLTQAKQNVNHLMAGAFVLICAAAAVMFRRNAKKAARASVKTIAMIMTVALAAGALMGGSFSNAYVASGSLWNLDDTSNPTKITSGKIAYKTSTASKSNANCFADVDAQFTKWASIQGCRLSFVNAGTTTNTVHSANDSVNFIAWDSNPNSDFSSATLAITYSLFSVGGKSTYIDGDMIFNDRDFAWGTGGYGNAKSVSLHEIGHFIGLNHTTTASTVMYPYDGGLTSLTSDEISAAVTLYPGQNVAPVSTPEANNPPVANVSGSPLNGPAPLNSFFDASATTQGTNAIATYGWNFGDGSTGSGKTINHTFTSAGSFNVTLTVTDDKGVASTATVSVTVTGAGSTTTTPEATTPSNEVPAETNGQLVHGSFKLVFAAAGRDSFTGTFYSQNASAFVQKARATAGRAEGTVMIGDAKFNFSFDGVSLKGTGDGGMKLAVSAKTGIVSLTIKYADLQTTLANYGFKNENVSGTAQVPVGIVFGNGADLAIKTSANFYYRGIAGKAGIGKY